MPSPTSRHRHLQLRWGRSVDEYPADSSHTPQFRAQWLVARSVVALQRAKIELLLITPKSFREGEQCTPLLGYGSPPYRGSCPQRPRKPPTPSREPVRYGTPPPPPHPPVSPTCLHRHPPLMPRLPPLLLPGRHSPTPSTTLTLSPPYPTRPTHH